MYLVRKSCDSNGQKKVKKKVKRKKCDEGKKERILKENNLVDNDPQTEGIKALG